ncbi:MAG: hypothetical protein IPQ13_11845 [Holophagaceae bacterium]|nr:hypothetical protein [Holophagaceae bacterium]
MIFNVYNYSGAAGAGVNPVNNLFEFVTIKLAEQSQNYIEFDFSEVRVISTKFAGRFIERVNLLRLDNSKLVVRIINAAPAIEEAFRRHKRN